MFREELRWLLEEYFPEKDAEFINKLFEWLCKHNVGVLNTHYLEDESDSLWRD